MVFSTVDQEKYGSQVKKVLANKKYIANNIYIYYISCKNMVHRPSNYYKNIHEMIIFTLYRYYQLLMPDILDNEEHELLIITWQNQRE